MEMPGLNPFAQAASLTVLAEYEPGSFSVRALGSPNLECHLQQIETNTAAQIVLLMAESQAQ
jgi:hypothetical protein